MAFLEEGFGLKVGFLEPVEGCLFVISFILKCNEIFNDTVPGAFGGLFNGDKAVGEVIPVVVFIGEFLEVYF